MNQMASDPYAVLGIQRGASDRQVQQAYRRLAKRYHPDLHPSGQTGEPMRRVNQAWEILSSPARRARYDAESSPGGSSSPGHWAASRVTPTRSPSPAAWNGAWTAPSTPREYRSAYAPAGSTPYAERDGLGWPEIVGTLVLGLVAFLFLFSGLLPFPFLGIAFLLLVRGTLRRFDAPDSGK